MCIVELISTGDGQVMETLDSLEIKLVVLAALTLSPWHGASSGCGWRNGLRYGG